MPATLTLAELAAWERQPDTRKTLMYRAQARYHRAQYGARMDHVAMWRSDFRRSRTKSSRSLAAMMFRMSLDAARDNRARANLYGWRLP